MQTSLSPSVCRAFLGCQIEKIVDELNLTKKIISCHPSHLPLADHVDCFVALNRSLSRLEFSEALFGVHSTFDGSMRLGHDSDILPKLALVHSFFSSCDGFRFLRMDSPRISMRWALCTRRSRMPSAMVGSPICSCQRETGSWEVRTLFGHLHPTAYTPTLGCGRSAAHQPAHVHQPFTRISALRVLVLERAGMHPPILIPGGTHEVWFLTSWWAC
jgi:hypothetical protein